MNKIKILTIFLVALLIYSCASMRTPEGGPKDVTPPKVLKMEPKDLTTNFSAKKIIIDFDEYIKLANEFKEFSISPEQEKPPILKAKARKLEITLQDTLDQNTTYTLNFGNAIVDINESNAVKNFTYVFSTGPTLDSISIAGNVKNSLTGEPELDAVVFILPLAKDTIFGKKKPSIYTRTDSSGNYRLKNLKKDTYKIYAIKETGGDKIYQQFTDQVGFIKEPFQLSQNLDSMNISIFKELPSTFIIVDRKLNNDGSISMNFNQQLRKPEITVIDPVAANASKFVRFNATNDSVKIWLSDLSFDSLKVAVKDEGISLDTVKLTRGKKDTYTRNIQAADNLDGQFLNPNKQLSLSFNFPITQIDLNKVLLLEDSIPRKGFTLEKDSTDLLHYTVKYPWKQNEDYIIKINEGAITGILNSKNKEITKNFKLAKTDEYGNISLKVNLPDTGKNYIVQLVNEKKETIIFSEPISKNTTARIANYRAGTYLARIIYDENKNGKWDTGNVKTGTQPEKIWYVAKEITIRANWNIEYIINVPK